MELEWSVSEAGVVFNINGQVAQYSHEEAATLLKDLSRGVEEAPKAEPPIHEEKAGDIVPLTPEEQAALKAAEA